MSDDELPPAMRDLSDKEVQTLREQAQEVADATEAYVQENAAELLEEFGE